MLHRTSADRIKADLDTLAQFTATPGQGNTRLSFTEEDRRARTYMMGQMRAAGLDVRIDGVGNIIGRLPSAAGKPVVVGSHLDSVPQGGNFDGNSGVVAGLEIARVLREDDLQLAVPYEVIAFTEEEGTRFGSALLGSRAMAGQVSTTDLDAYRDPAGVSFADAARSFGIDLDPEGCRREKGSIGAYFELHIEQGPSLESQGAAVGVVTEIVGVYQAEVTFRGASGHAGACPMHLRHDPMMAAFGAVLRLRDHWMTRTGVPSAFTVGCIDAEPGGKNVIPSAVRLTIDVRDAHAHERHRLLATLPEVLRQTTGIEGIEVEYRELIDAQPVRLSRSLRGDLLEAASRLGIDAPELPSGAGHDAQVMAEIADETAMVFIQSRGGHSHRPDEYSDPAHIASGADLILNAILARWAS